MLSVAPVSVTLIGVFAMLVIAFAVTRMTILMRRVPRPAFREPATREFPGSGA
jgi:hypothetical protein